MTDRGVRHRRARQVVPPLVGTLLSAAAWVGLVVVAVEFGRRGRDGDAIGWVLLALAALGAAVCLVVSLIFGRQLLVAGGVISDYRPKRARR